jgi:hypothetical protein
MSEMNTLEKRLFSILWAMASLSASGSDLSRMLLFFMHAMNKTIRIIYCRFCNYFRMPDLFSFIINHELKPLPFSDLKYSIDIQPEICFENRTDVNMNTPLT